VKRESKDYINIYQRRGIFMQKNGRFFKAAAVILGIAAAVAFGVMNIADMFVGKEKSDKSNYSNN
jgi:hypothetical protein